jgi:hypothetical protein
MTCHAASPHAACDAAAPLMLKKMPADAHSLSRGRQAMIVPDAMQAILASQSATEKGSVPSTTFRLVHLRAQLDWKLPKRA